VDWTGFEGGGEGDSQHARPPRAGARACGPPRLRFHAQHTCVRACTYVRACVRSEALGKPLEGTELTEAIKVLAANDKKVGGGQKAEAWPAQTPSRAPASWTPNLDSHLDSSSRSRTSPRGTTSFTLHLHIVLRVRRTSCL
jgi:hypothetical protein